MKALTKEQPLDNMGLLTLMCEVEAIISGRPITKVSDDPSDPEAPRPNTCCYCDQDLPNPLVGSAKNITTLVAGGNEFST